MRPRHLCVLLLAILTTACLGGQPIATPALPPTLDATAINLDPDTQTLIANADRVAFLIPFSHWDTDWHDIYPNYVKRSDGNILAAIQLAKADPRFRYALEQVLFVQHFWDTYPDQREDLKHFIQNRQFTFAWAGITQPETSLVAPAIQVRNLQLGRQWIADTFGPDYVPQTAWQSDAFGNSAAFPIFLSSHDIPYLFIGRWQNRCDPDFDDCEPLPHLFYWQSPAADSKVLVTYSSYPSAWDSIHRLATEAEQITALQAYIETQFARTESRFVFIPMGSDFIDPLPNVNSLVERWNTTDDQIKLVIADPATAFHYIETQTLPTMTVDLNPIWQAFYATRPIAKIADKESDYYLTANDKFSIVLNTPPSTAWNLAAMNAHYDNISAVGFDSVWESTQRPRFEQTVSTAADDLSATLAAIAGAINAPLIIFNPTSWARSEIIEIEALPDIDGIPVGQQLTDTTRAIQVDAVPGIGWGTPDKTPTDLAHPTSVTTTDGLVTLTNGLVAVSLDPAHGGAISSLTASQTSLLATFSDDLTFWQDTGDVYGASFGDVLARESDTNAQIEILAEGPLLARARLTFTLNSQPVIKTVTLRANSPLIEVELTFAITPDTSAIVHTHTNLHAQTRTDDLGFAFFNHELDNAPIAPGDRTYRRKIFYPITYWSDVSESGSGLALITHGLQGLGGTSDLNLLLTRDVREDQEGVTDTEPHTFRYAYLPHAGPIPDLPQLAYAFNQPLIPVLKSSDGLTVQLPFTTPRQFASAPTSVSLPSSRTLLSAEGALVLDLYHDGDQLNAVIVDYEPDSAGTLNVGDETITLPTGPLVTLPIRLK